MADSQKGRGFIIGDNRTGGGTDRFSASLVGRD